MTYGIGLDLPEVESDTVRAMLYAIGQHDETTVHRLLEEGLDANLPLSDGFNFIHHAAMVGHPGIMGILLQHGANKNVHGGRLHLTPLDILQTAGSSFCNREWAINCQELLSNAEVGVGVGVGAGVEVEMAAQGLGAELLRNHNVEVEAGAGGFGGVGGAAVAAVGGVPVVRAALGV
jgi:hypothetical protein